MSRVTSALLVTLLMAFAAFGVPVAMLALNEVQLAAVGGASDIEMVAGDATVISAGGGRCVGRPEVVAGHDFYTKPRGHAREPPRLPSPKKFYRPAMCQMAGPGAETARFPAPFRQQSLTQRQVLCKKGRREAGGLSPRSPRTPCRLVPKHPQGRSRVTCVGAGGDPCPRPV
jgi:hypothetical protein